YSIAVPFLSRSFFRFVFHIIQKNRITHYAEYSLGSHDPSRNSLRCIYRKNPFSHGSLPFFRQRSRSAGRHHGRHRQSLVGNHGNRILQRYPYPNVREDLPSPWLPVPLCTKGSPRFETYLRQYDRQYLRPGMGSDSGRPKSHGGTGKAGG